MCGFHINMAKCEHKFLDSELKTINKFQEKGEIDNGFTFAVAIEDIVVKDI